MNLSGRRRRLAAGLGLAAGLAGASTLFASGFTVAPIRVTLSPQTSSTLISVDNPSESPLNIQVSGFQWSLDQNGETRLESTEELLFFPPLLEVPPHAERRVRIGATVPFGKIEKSYRLIFEELQNPQKLSGPHIQFLARFSIPVFLAPEKPQKSLRIAGASWSHGRLSFREENPGNVHAPPHKLRVSGRDAAGSEVFVRELADWYLLPGTSRPFTIDLPAEACPRLGVLEVLGEADGVPFAQRLLPGPDACAPP
jgi:fimbrial chaperone protein